MTKIILRQQFRALRQKISLQERAFAAQVIVDIFLNEFSNRKFFNIAAYVAHNDELDVKLLIERLWQLEYSVFLPVVDTQTLHFVSCDKATTLIKNNYGIEEPAVERNRIEPFELDIVLVPLVAFDKMGTRLGMGKGYYDKTFASHCEKKESPVFVGVAFSLQCAEYIPVDAWDVPLDYVLTEKEMIKFN